MAVCEITFYPLSKLVKIGCIVLLCRCILKVLCITPIQNMLVRCMYYICPLGVYILTFSTVVSVSLNVCGFKRVGPESGVDISKQECRLEWLVTS